MSHGAQEVFHSDLLAYVANHQPEFFKSVMQGLGLDDAYGRVEREWKRFDLAFFRVATAPDSAAERDAEEPYLVIENKFKSLPNEEQIEGYREKLNDKTIPFHFLTLFNTDTHSICHTNTHVVTYADLVEQMKAHLGSIDTATADGEFLRELIERYIGFVTLFRSVIEPFVPLDTGTIEGYRIGDYFCRPDYIEKNPDYKQITDMRLESPVKNLRMSRLCHLLCERLSAAGLDLSEETDRVTLSSGIASKKALIECRLNIGEPYATKGARNLYRYCYFIQFDNGVINHGVEVNNQEGMAIKNLSKTEKKAQRANIAEALDKIQELKPLKELIDELRPTAGNRKMRGFNNMITTRLHAEPIFEKTVGEGLDLMADEIIKYYRSLYDTGSC